MAKKLSEALKTRPTVFSPEQKVDESGKEIYQKFNGTLRELIAFLEQVDDARCKVFARTPDFLRVYINSLLYDPTSNTVVLSISKQVYSKEKP